MPESKNNWDWGALDRVYDALCEAASAGDRAAFNAAWSALPPPPAYIFVGRSIVDLMEREIVRGGGTMPQSEPIELGIVPVLVSNSSDAARAGEMVEAMVRLALGVPDTARIIVAGSEASDDNAAE